MHRQRIGIGRAAEQRELPAQPDAEQRKDLFGLFLRAMVQLRKLGAQRANRTAEPFDVGAVRDQATSLVDEQRGRAADQIASMAGMVRNSVQSLDRESAGAICQYADDTASAIDNFADRLRTASWGEIADDVEDFGRRWPMVFMASAIATGFIAGRFLISSGSRRHETSTPAQTPSPNTTAPGMLNEPHGGARYDYGAVGGTVSGTGKAGYGAMPGKETH